MKITFTATVIVDHPDYIDYDLTIAEFKKMLEEGSLDGEIIMPLYDTPVMLFKPKEKAEEKLNQRKSMEQKHATEVGYMLETTLGYLNMAKHHCIDKLNKPTLKYIEQAIKHLEIANRHLFESSLTPKERVAYERMKASAEKLTERKTNE